MSELDEDQEARLWELGRQLRRLADPPVDRPELESAYYRVANDVIEGVIAIPARTVTGLKVKAEAVAWCHGGRVDVGPIASQADRLVASLVTDLLAAA